MLAMKIVRNYSIPIIWPEHWYCQTHNSGGIDNIWYWDCWSNIAICRSIQCLEWKQLDSSPLCSIEQPQWHHSWRRLSIPCCWKQLWRIVTVKEVLKMCLYKWGHYHKSILLFLDHCHMLHILITLKNVSCSWELI